MLRNRLVVAVAALLATSACSGEPTVPGPPLSGPRFDAGGYGLGSGNRSDSTSSQTNAAPTLSSEAAAGGYGLGSGN